MVEHADSAPRSWFITSDELFISEDGYLRIPHPNAQAPIRLLCFPPAGAEGFMYDGWVALLPESIELCAVQLPDSDQYRESATVISLLGETILHHAREGQQLVFCGICLGAFWAYEVARYLFEKYGIELAHFVVTTFPAPHVRGKITAYMRTSAFTDMMISYMPEGSPEQQYAVSRVPVMMHDADLADQETAPLTTPLHCPITAFGSSHDQVVDPESMWSWQGYTDANFRVHICDGDHFYADHHLADYLEALIGYLKADGLQI
ncbi:thioesterase II family protein [Tengunoibacter tsumagoiensis]|uniref:Thioesterase domain-containing protein n=1 Tax=Tengunoibacter tsumagoiensis TaxID=2014871 RepID=A0A402A9D4_9CHLR|nr:thioesterase domain-containing protein [Tengunoibacter tsumagoiensis]GCE15794.1 hypothetical protein KTT_56530 [Tengunoibacter tsumagoiensis]